MSTPISLPDKLYEQVQQTAQNNQQTVDEYVAELISSALNGNGSVPISGDDALAEEARAWESLYPMLKEKYPGQYVAVYQGEVVDVDGDILSLNRRIRTNYPNKRVWVSRVEEEPFAEIFMRSPRLER